MEYAKQRLLGAPQQTIAEISENSGFMSPSHFMRIFKEKEGCSPAKWRKAQAEKSVQTTKICPNDKIKTPQTTKLCDPDK